MGYLGRVVLINTEPVNQKTKKHLVPILIMTGLLFLRFPLLIASSFKIITIPNVFELYIDCTYLLTACLIVYERNKLLSFNIGLSSITMFIIIPILKPIIYFVLKNSVAWKGSYPFSWYQVAIAVILLVVLIYKHPTIYKEKIKDSLKWIVISGAVGVLYAVITGLVYKTFTSPSSMKATFPVFIYLFITQLNNAAPSEEPLFRGFIWGYLRNRKWKEHWIWLFQAAIFSLGHIYYLPDVPIAFLGTLTAGLVLGLVVWKSKNISTSIIVHGLINSMGDLIMHFLW